MERWFALVDCNNFFASCEILWRPDLENRPVCVLGPNDSIIIARNQLAKDLGIKMGENYFKSKKKLERLGVVLFSSNYSMYSDISDRIRQYLEETFPICENYSIDESFLELTPLAGADFHKIANNIKKDIAQLIGIPVSVGIAPTKTLAKLANHYAKRITKTGAEVFEQPQQWHTLLKEVELTDIWGIGSRRARRLRLHGITSPYQLLFAHDGLIRQEMSIMGLRTVRELRGEACLDMETQPPPRKTILYSRSFSRRIDCFDELVIAITTFTRKLAKKLQHHRLAASHLRLFLIHTQYIQDQRNSSSWGAGYRLLEATNYAPTLHEVTQKLLEKIYVPGQSYNKAGILSTGLQANQHIQRSLWGKDECEKAREDRLSHAINDLHFKFGRNVLFWGNELEVGKFSMKQERLSPKYTTNSDELLHINIDQTYDSKK